MRDFDNYLENHLLHYIREELSNGYSINSIEKVLLDHGHKYDLIKKCISDLKKEGFRPARKREYVDGLSQELYFKIRHAIISYINSQRKKGYSMEEIKKVLTEYGHSQDMIEEAVHLIINEEPSLETPQKGKRPKVKKTKKSKKGFNPLTISLLIIIALIIITSVGANVSLGIVLLAYSPMILTLILLEALAPRSKVRSQLILIPILVTLIFYVVVTQTSLTLFQDMEFKGIMTLNLVISLILTILYMLKK